MPADQPLENTSVILTRIRDAKIDSVMVVDDAFDPVRVADVNDRITEFWSPFIRQGEQSQSLQEELEQFCQAARKAEKWNGNGVLSDPKEITDCLLQFLFDHRDTYLAIARIADSSVFAEKLEKLESVVELCELLKPLVGEDNITQHGSDVDLSNKSARVIFLDYYLGAANDETAIEQAKTRIKEIYNSVPEGDEKPFVVLMSSKDVIDVDRKFCEDAGLLRGLLTFAPKKELNVRELLKLHLATWSLHLPERHAIQRFVEALENSLNQATNTFQKRIRGLGIEDYANIQWLSLQDDGHPLGDYMLWLFKAMLSHLLHDDQQVLSQQEELDSMTVEAFLPNHAPPSSDLAELYRYATMVPGVGPAGPHPRSNEDAGDICLSLGDMFFRENDDHVLIVLNAACDLAYSPNSVDRPFPSQRFILFNHGRLQPIQDVQGQASLRIQPYKHRDDDNVYRINWYHSKAVWKPYGECKQWLEKDGYIRTARMALPYALELQKSFANHITRVGMPVLPPVTRWCSVAVCCVSDDGKWKQIEVIENGVQLIRKRTGEDQYEETFVVAKAAIMEMVKQIDDVKESLEQQKTDLSRQAEANDEDNTGSPPNLQQLNGKITGLENKITKLNDLAEASDVWLTAVETSRSLPCTGKQVEIDAGCFWVYLDADYTQSFGNGPPILLNILQQSVAPDNENEDSCNGYDGT